MVKKINPIFFLDYFFFFNYIIIMNNKNYDRYYGRYDHFEWWCISKFLKFFEGEFYMKKRLLGFFFQINQIMEINHENR